MTRWGFLPLAAFLMIGAGSASAAEALPGGPVYVRMQSISFSVIGPTNKIDKEVSVLLDLELDDGKTEQMLAPYDRQIADSFLLALTSLYEDGPPGAAVSAESLKQRLLDVATTVTGPGFVHSVLIISMGERAHH